MKLEAKQIISNSLAEVGICYLPHHSGLAAPCHATEGSAGYDIYAACDESVVINPGPRA